MRGREERIKKIGKEGAKGARGEEGSLKPSLDMIAVIILMTGGVH